MAKNIQPAFWLANAQEAMERLAYFGIRAVLPLMMVSAGTGGLGLSMFEKGIIYTVWALIQCLIPMVSGGFSESFGYKKSLIVAFTINAIGYVLMANILNLSELITGPGTLNTTVNFWLMMLAGCTIGLGTAIFKPPVQGTVAKSLNKESSSFGFGLFYWVVNIGGFLAPLCASALRGSDTDPTWHYVFYSAAAVTVFNLIVTLIFFKEPERTPEEIEKNKSTSPGRVFINTLLTLWNDKSMLWFLIIVSGFWLMFMQLWDLLPNFLDEWVDRRDVGNFLSQYSIFQTYLESDGALKPEMVINIDSAAIILFVIPISAILKRFKMITALVLGMVISIIGFILSGVTNSGAFACLGVLVFAIGEIICSPKFNEYIGMTAPADKKAIYMGYANIPFAVGWAVGNFLSGTIYELFASKKDLASRWLIDHGTDPTALANLQPNEILSMMQAQSGAPDIYAANQLLWDAYNPWIIWYVLGAIGVASMAGMIVFYFKSGMAERDNAEDKANADSADQPKAALDEPSDSAEHKANSDSTDAETKDAHHAESEDKLPLEEKTEN
ncbi:MAG: MFS transporter [Proteobacteria bacterium]|nr:MFS transporter [Pseudomonadota bacterium]